MLLLSAPTGCGLVMEEYLRELHLLGTGSDKKRPGLLDFGLISLMAGVPNTRAITTHIHADRSTHLQLGAASICGKSKRNGLEIDW